MVQITAGPSGKNGAAEITERQLRSGRNNGAATTERKHKYKSLTHSSPVNHADGSHKADDYSPADGSHKADDYSLADEDYRE